MDPKKVYIITKWQAPNYIKDVQAFLNFTNFYQKFIYNFLIIPYYLYKHLLAEKVFIN